MPVRFVAGVNAPRRRSSVVSPTLLAISSKFDLRIFLLAEYRVKTPQSVMRVRLRRIEFHCAFEGYKREMAGISSSGDDPDIFW